MDNGMPVKGKLYITALVIVITLNVVLTALRDRISSDTVHLLYGILIGLALVFLAASARAIKRIS